jgi:hypothetical protein
MANMGPYLAEKYTKMIEAITNDLGNTADKLAQAQNILRALKNPDMLVDGSPLTLERLQVMENGDIRTLPPPPEMTCIEEVTKEFVKNGKKTETAMAELVEIASDSA